MRYLFSLLFLALAVTPAFAAESFYNGHLYTLVQGDWLVAEQNAVAWGGTLVTINNQAEELWLQSEFGSSLFWIGLNDAANEGVWQWVSGEAVTYTNWAAGQPNNFDNQDYVVMNSGTDLKWNDSWSNVLVTNQGIAEKIVSSPEPLSAGLFILGGAGLALVRRRKRVE